MVHSNFDDGNVTPLFFSGCFFLHLVAKASAFKGCGGMVTPRMGSGRVGVYLDYHGFYV
jgi:hypothetical protein